MANINVLDKNTINQIAAGEVVDRPCSVVKELVENAVDAKATAITVEIKEGGTTLIRVSDNGMGIDKDDIKIAFLRHSTSKIKTVEDLLTIGSLGFRGEALSSISSVAYVELVTKTRSAFTGSHFIIDGGDEIEFTEIGCPEGTTFIVRNLFHNIPARKKFLKSPMTEGGYINDLMERMAVSNINIAFKYINNNKTMLHTSGNGELKDVIYHIYGRDITSNLIEVEEDINDVNISGYIGKPVISRGNRDYENYFINGRFIKSNIITKAIEEAYKPYSMHHKYPFTVLNLKIDSSTIDVNVHPTKLEVRFLDGEELYRTVFTIIKNALSGRNMIPSVTIDKPEKEHKKKIEGVPEPFEAVRLNKFLDQSTPVLKDEIREKSKAERENEINEMNRSSFMNNDTNTSKVMEESLMLKNVPYKTIDLLDIKEVSDNKLNYIVSDMPTAVDIPETKSSTNYLTVPKELPLKEQIPGFRTWRIIGQLFSTYWLAEHDNQLYIIDQHAAHEKILYEELIKKFHQKNDSAKVEFYSQIISPPIIITLLPRELEMLNRYRDFLESIGFTIEHFGGKEYAVSEVPIDIYGIDGKELIISLLSSIADETTALTTDIIIEKIASMSCKAAVKGNHTISLDEAKVMLKRLASLDNPFHCPHGRPVIIAMTKNEIEKKFKRIL